MPKLRSELEERNIHVLLVGDDDNCRATKNELIDAGIGVTLCSDWPIPDTASRRPSFDMAVLSTTRIQDLVTLCSLIRWLSDIPLLVLFDRTDEADGLACLTAGADDWLSRPFERSELIARTQSVLRHSKKHAPVRAPNLLAFEGFCVDRVHRHVINPEGRFVELTNAEFDLLSAFCAFPGRILTRKELLDLTNLHFGSPSDRTIDVHVRNLRLKIEKDPGRPVLIKTIRLAGYVLAALVRTIGRP